MELQVDFLTSGVLGWGKMRSPHSPGFSYFRRKWNPSRTQFVPISPPKILPLCLIPWALIPNKMMVWCIYITIHKKGSLWLIWAYSSSAHWWYIFYSWELRNQILLNDELMSFPPMAIGWQQVWREHHEIGLDIWWHVTRSGSGSSFFLHSWSQQVRLLIPDRLATFISLRFLPRKDIRKQLPWWWSASTENYDSKQWGCFGRTE